MCCAELALVPGLMLASVTSTHLWKTSLWKNIDGVFYCLTDAMLLHDAYSEFITCTPTPLYGEVPNKARRISLVYKHLLSNNALQFVCLLFASTMN